MPFFSRFSRMAFSLKVLTHIWGNPRGFLSQKKRVVGRVQNFKQENMSADGESLSTSTYVIPLLPCAREFRENGDLRGFFSLLAKRGLLAPGQGSSRKSQLRRKRVFSVSSGRKEKSKWVECQNLPVQIRRFEAIWQGRSHGRLAVLERDWRLAPVALLAKEAGIRAGKKVLNSTICLSAITSGSRRGEMVCLVLCPEKKNKGEKREILIC